MKTTPVRREGFAGQHLVVLPPPVRKTAADHPLLRALLVTDAGFFPRAAGHRVERPQGSATHLLIACIAGRGWVRAGGRTQPVAPGDLLWLSSDHPHAYGADAAAPWTIVWAHFCGAEVEAWQRQFGFDPRHPSGRLHLEADRLADLEFDEVYALLERGYSVPQLLAAATALRATLCAALRLEHRAGPERSAAQRTALVRDQLVRTPERAYRLAELAATARLSVPRFTQLFRQLTGYAPIDFLIRQRVRNACRLLDTTDLGIARIGAEVGIADPYYFSRCFRRVMGCSPLAYRRTVKA